MDMAKKLTLFLRSEEYLTTWLNKKLFRDDLGSCEIAAGECEKVTEDFTVGQDGPLQHFLYIDEMDVGFVFVIAFMCPPSVQPMPSLCVYRKTPAKAAATPEVQSQLPGS